VADDSGSANRSGSGGDPTLTNVDPARGGGAGSKSAFEPIFAVGQVLAGRYRVERFIARGGMGEVYQVHDQELGESVALKTILARSAGDRVSLDRFRREIQIARKVSHRNVCRIFDLGRHVQPDGEDVVFLTMELLGGVSLRARLRNGVMKPDEALDLVTQLAAGLGAAHRMGIVHRDLKPSNIFLVPEGDSTRLVIADFGLARSQFKEEGQLTVTGTGEILGTPAYMSPEQIEGKPATTASDVYSLGLVMYEMLTGVQAFEGESAFQIALNKLREAPTSPSMRSPGIPPRWDKTILRCLDVDPERRFADVEQIPAVLAGTRRPPGRRMSAAGRRRVIWTAVGLTAIAAGVVGLVVSSGWPKRMDGAASREVVVVRRSVAVLGFENLTGDPEEAWISTALGDFLTTELAAGGAVRTIPSESVVHARSELKIDRVTTLGSETLSRLRDLLATDLVVVGSYAVFGDGGDTTIRLDSRVQDVTTDEIIVLESVTGPKDDLARIAVEAATRIRRRFGLDPVVDSVTVQAFPSNPDAARLYAEGVRRLRSFDPSGARRLLAEAAETEPGSPLIWLELADASSRLGYGNDAIEAARQARDLSEGLDRELRLRIEGQYQLFAGQTGEAVNTFRSLWLVYPDNLEYGLLLADAQLQAERPADSLATVAELRALPAPLSDDPRIDLAEASAAGESQDANRQAAAAERVVTASREIGSALLEAEGRLALGSALTKIGELDRALVELEAARGLEEATSNRAGEAKVAYSMALTHLARGEVDAAVRETETTLKIAREVEARASEGDALNLLGSIRLHQGDFPAALNAFSAALDLQREIRNRSGETEALNNLALVQMWSGDFVGAVDSFTQVRAEFRDLGKPMGEAAAVMNLARIDAARGDLVGARSLFEEAAGLYRAQQSAEELSEALFGLGEVLLTQGDLQAARTRHEEALAIRRQHQFPSLTESEFALAGLTLSEAALGRRSYDAAVQELTRSVTTLAEQDRPALEADALNYLAEAQIGAGRFAEAETTLNRVRELAPSANSVTLMVLRINDAKLAAARGRVGDAESTLEDVLAAARAESSFGVEIEARLAMAEIAAGAGRTEEARRRLEEVSREATARGWMLVADRAAVIENRLGDESG